jgi:hypothetical protein
MAEDKKHMDRKRGRASRPTDYFRQWERRGRGWTTHPHRVPLEPPFEAFNFHDAPYEKPHDDARKKPFIGSLWEKVKGKSEKARVGKDNEHAIADVEPDDAGHDHDHGVAADDLVEIAVVMPQDIRLTPDLAEQFLVSISNAGSPVGFEIVGRGESIEVQIACNRHDSDHIKQKIEAFFPSAMCESRRNFLESNLAPSRPLLAINFGLRREFTRPLRCVKNFEPDVLTSAFASLENLGKGETACLQVLFKAVTKPWSEQVLKAMIDRDGRSFFADAPEAVSLAKEKIQSQLVAAVIRVVVQADSEEKAWKICRDLGGSLNVLNSPNNELIPITGAHCSSNQLLRDVVERQTRLHGMILNAREASMLAHFPSSSVKSKKLKRQTKRTKKAPPIALGHKTIIGINSHQGEDVTVSIGMELRSCHSFLIGATGVGKTSLGQNIVLQDIEAGAGVAVIDIQGDLVDDIVCHFPESRHGDIILFDASDEIMPTGMNILSTTSEVEKIVAVSDTAMIFKRFSSSWGDQMTSVLSNAVLAMLESSEEVTLLHLRKFLIDKDYRAKFLETVKDPQVVDFWKREFHLLYGKPLGPVLTRLNTFLRPKVVRNIVSQKKGLDFNDIVKNKKVLLIKLAMGLIGEVNAYILGALIVSKLNQVAMAQQTTIYSERDMYTVFLDEFYHFINPSMASILAQARKWRLSFLLACQDLRQLSERDKEVMNSVISNPGTRICFRLGDFDAKKLEDGFSFFSAEDLQGLSRGEAICRMESRDNDFNLKTFPPRKVDPAELNRKKKILTELTRKKYGTPREQIESEIAQEEFWAVASSKSSSKKTSKKSGPYKNSVAPEKSTNNEVGKTSEPLIPGSETAIAEDIQVTEGKGGHRHRYLQTFFKKMAEDLGFKADIEQPLPDGTGTVDVGLGNGALRIAIEVSCTTEKNQEYKNIRKCVAANFDEAILVAEKDSTLKNVKELIEKNLDEVDRGKVYLLKPEDVHGHLQERARPDEGEGKMNGYQVQVNYQPLDEEAEKNKREAVSKVLMQSIKRDRNGE